MIVPTQTRPWFPSDCDPYMLKDYHVRRRWLSQYVEAARAGGDVHPMTLAVVEKLRAYNAGMHLLRDAIQDEAVYADFEVVYQVQSVTLRAYPSLTSAPIPILLIPSLINHSTIFDLCQEQSLIRYLQSQGLQVFMVDWGSSDNDTQHYGLQGAIDDYLVPFLAHMQEYEGKPPVVLGYCLGATLALALASKVEEIRGLVLLAPPWDFSELSFAKDQTLHFPSETLNATIMPVVPGLLIYQFLNMPFWEEVGEKYVATSNPTKAHVALDAWIHSPRDLSCVMVRDLMDVLLKDNRPESFLSKSMEDINIPTFVVSAQHDHLVPDAAIRPLLSHLPRVEQLIVSMGHLGLVASQKAPRDVWEPLVRWIHNVQG